MVLVRNNVANPTDSYSYQRKESKMNDVNRLKRNMTLNLQDGISCPTVLSSPDIRKFKLTTPDIVKFFAPGNNSKTLTPNNLFTMKEDAYQTSLADVHNLENVSGQMNNIAAELHRNNLNNNSNNTELSNGFMEYNTSLPTVVLPEPLSIKDEPQTVPSLNSSPSMSPIDMESQEAIKLQRKRYKNRLAASKCRKRKLERIAKLEDKVKALKSGNHELLTTLTRLKGEVATLKQEVIKHHENGCSIVGVIDH